MATSPGVRSPLGGPPHLLAALVPSRRRRRGSWCPSPMPSGAGSHVPGSAAVPALPRLAPHPMARRRAGGRGRLWADAGAAPNPSKQMLPVCHPLGDAIGQCCRRSACPPRLLSRERRKATVLAEQRPPASLTDFQRRPSFIRFAPVTAHRWTFILTCSLPSAAAPTHLTYGWTCFQTAGTRGVFAGFTISVCFRSSFRSPTGL